MISALRRRRTTLAQCAFFRVFGGGSSAVRRLAPSFSHCHLSFNWNCVRNRRPIIYESLRILIVTVIPVVWQGTAVEANISSSSRPKEAKWHPPFRHLFSGTVFLVTTPCKRLVDSSRCEEFGGTFVYSRFQRVAPFRFACSPRAASCNYLYV